MTRGGLIVLVLVSGCCLPPPAAGSTAGLLPLTGEIRVASCTQYPCPTPATDDPRWSSFVLGPEGIPASLNQREGLAWVALRFHVPPGAKPARPALFISHPPDAEEVFLNGEPVGGRGLIRPRFASVVSGPRILPLPAAAVRDGANEILFFSLFANRNTRFFTGPFLLGEQDRVEAAGWRLVLPIVATEAAFSSMYFVVFVFYVFLVLKRVIRSDYLFFMAFIVLNTADFLIGSHLFRQNDVVQSEFVFIQAVLGSTRSLIMLSLVTHVTGSKFGAVFWLFAAIGAGFVALDLALPPLTGLTVLDFPRKVFLGLLGLYYLVVAARAVRRKGEEAVPVLTGVTFFVVGSRIDLFWGIPMRDYAIAVFALGMLFALTSRHARMRNRIEVISARLLDAHEFERRRIARDIHDGVGQSLLALRLKLQKLAAAAKRGVAPAHEPLEAIAADTGAILEEIRRLSMDLRPSFIESMSLKDLLNWYGSSFAEARGLDLRIRDGVAGVLDPSPQIKDNLYRIFQEILTNIAKHAAASHIEVSLYREDKRLVLEVADDGLGFAASSAAGGIGLETMRERAELIGGSCRIESIPDHGTRVKIEVEVP